MSDQLFQVHARKLLGRVIFGTLEFQQGMFTLDRLSEVYLAAYGVGMDIELAKIYLAELIKSGYVTQQDNYYGVIMVPVEQQDGR